MGVGARSAEEASDSGVPTVWVVVFGIVFLGLVGSMLRFVTADHLPARFVDVEQTRLEPTATGTRLHLVLRHAPHHGQLVHEVDVPADGGPPVVTVRLSATGKPAPPEGADDRRALEIDLPDVERVRVVDLRWAREEAVVVERSDSGP